MSVRSSQAITKVFTTRRFDTGAATNADSTPTGTLYVNGTANAATVTVTNITTGVYKAAVTLPSLSLGDVVDLRVAATVNSVTDNGIIWTDTSDGSSPSELLAATVDTVALSTLLTNVQAFAAGLVGVTDNGDGTYALTFKKQDGTTTAFTRTYNPATGTRT